ncbi:patatin-like phospholipase family protein [Kribbella sp. NBC_01510]|uniref:patatin-like phospholipase family protein n=1 Tax=Kribbella sp. NBC_01510 TaxID=2903581 RepID=UPI0038707FEC
MGTPMASAEPLWFPDFRPRRVAVVVAGAGARGGYEAGVLSVLLPCLEAAGVVPTLFVGTSAGAINATLYAAAAHLPAVEQGEAVLEVWRNIRTHHVFRSPMKTGIGSTGKWVGQLLRIRGLTLTSLLDTSPLRQLARTVVKWDQLRTNLDDGRIALAVVTTSGADNRTVVFVDRGGADLPPSDDSRPIDYRRAKIGPDHVLASAAIPVVFPPVRVPAEDGTPSGWYIDGGVRLNTPLKPALALEADAVVIVANHPAFDAASGIEHTQPGTPPDVDDTLVRVIDAALVDRMIEDVNTLAKINVQVGAAEQLGSSGQSVANHAVVPFLAIGPPDRGTLGLLAAEVFDRRPGGLGGLRRLAADPDMRLLGRLLHGDGSRRGDLLSYLFFEPEFMEAAIERGRSDAKAAFDDVIPGRVPWQFGPPNERAKR